jgi:Ca-activated chloride channel family protein
MNDKQIDDLLDQNIPEAGSNARKIAINLAMSEFSQAFDESARPIGTRDTLFSKAINTFRRFFMNTPSTPRISNTFATIAIAFVAVSVFFFLPERQDPNLITRPTSTEIESVVKIDNADVTAQDELVVSRANSQAPSPQAIEPTDQVLANEKDSTKLTEKQNESEQFQAAEPIKELVVKGNSKNENVAVRKPAPAQQLLGNEVESRADRSSASNSALVETVAPKQSPESFSPLERTSQTTAKQSHSLEEVIVTGAKREGGFRANRMSVQKATVGSKSSDTTNTSSAYLIPAPTESATAGAPRPDLGEEYAKYQSSTVQLVSEHPVSTFSADVDTASYSLVRNQLKRGFLPSPQAVRAEELINYFDYGYALPDSKKQPFKPSISVLDSPWNKDKKLIHIGIKGYDLDPADQPNSNIVFLLDVSGSMSSENKLPLVKQSIGLLLETLKPSDTVSIVVYAGAAGTVLEPTKASDKTKIVAALQRLSAGGSTAGGAGIELAYQLAEQNFNKNSVNRIVLATDGDFNVGLQSNDALKTLVERKRDKGIFLSVLGFGRNNYQDDMMQALAQNGNGVAAYIDTLAEAKKVLVDEATSTLFTIAKDVKLQVEFNPAKVSEYRLIGYETRALNREDFNNDKVDAGDIGAGHTVTAVYEITPINSDNKSIDTPRYAENRIAKPATEKNQEYGFLKIRYKLPNDSKSKLIERAILSNAEKETLETRFSIAVAGFAQLLTGGKYTTNYSYDDVINLALKAKGEDTFGYRSEFIQLVRMAKIAKP